MDLKNLNDSIVFNEEHLTKRILFSTSEELCFVLNFKIGQALPIHKHENSKLVVTVLSGAGEIKINNDTVKINQGSILLAYGEDDFSIPSVTEDMSVLVIINPRPINEMYSKDF